MPTTIKNLEGLIKPTLKQGQEIISYDIENLLTSGENYGSVMLKIQLKIRNKNGGEEVIHCVGKTCPPSPYLWEIFNTKVTFKKEIAVYKTIVPSFNEFCKEHGMESIMDFFANSLGARISLDPLSNEVDNDALLLLENLKMQGYDVVDRLVGFDEDSAKYILQNLATLHAVPIAYKAAKPEEFKTKILPYLNKDLHYKPSSETLAGLIKQIQDALARNPKCVPHLQKVEIALKKMVEDTNDPLKCNDIFKTLAHHDLWVNNTMLKYQNGKPIGNRIIDFQMFEYSSLANDVIFFMYSSLSQSVLESKIDELMKFYYEHFIQTLVKFKYDISDYSFESMMEEFALVAASNQFAHIILLLPAIMTLKEEARELSEFREDSVIKAETALHENYYKKQQFMLLDFIRRGWI